MSRIIFTFLLGVFLLQGTLSAIIKIPPEANWDFREFMSQLKYPLEEHTVTTSDGYILTLFRIQAKNTQIRSGLPVALLNHGLLDSSDSFIINEEHQAPGFILANSGFDVWFVNNRGNVYSLGHTKYDSSDAGSAFWDFSWQEMSQYDLPAAIQFVSSKTGQKVNYVGHSEGCTLMFAALARRDATVLQHLNKFIALAPAVFLEHSTSPLVQIGGWIQAGSLLEIYSSLMNKKKYGFRSPAMKKTWETICVVALDVCILRIRLISDSNTKVDNVKRLPITNGHYPAGSSVQNLHYWSQMFNKKEFRMFDYGKAGNEKAYGSANPPVYDLGKIQEPVYMFVGEYDELASPADTAKLRSQLTGSSKVEYRRYALGHASFMWALDVATYMNDVIQTLRS